MQAVLQLLCICKAIMQLNFLTNMISIETLWDGAFCWGPVLWVTVE